MSYRLKSTQRQERQMCDWATCTKQSLLIIMIVIQLHVHALCLNSNVSDLSVENHVNIAGVRKFALISQFFTMFFFILLDLKDFHKPKESNS